MIPLYGFLQGDTIGLLILAQPGETMAALADKLQASAAVRIARRERMVVRWKDRVLDGRITVAQAGLTALDRFDVVPAAS
jgi:hypothetical protein